MLFKARRQGAAELGKARNGLALHGVGAAGARVPGRLGRLLDAPKSL
jgi:hypothetical protein